MHPRLYTRSALVFAAEPLSVECGFPLTTLGECIAVFLPTNVHLHFNRPSGSRGLCIPRDART